MGEYEDGLDQLAEAYSIAIEEKNKSLEAQGTQQLRTDLQELG